MATQLHFMHLVTQKQATENRLIPIAEIARETHLSVQTLHQLKAQDRTGITFRVIDAFRKYFECDYNALFSDDGTPPATL